MSDQYINNTAKVYFHFASNDTSGSGGDGASAAVDVRECGALASAASITTGVTVSLLSDASYPAGCYEIEVDTATGYSADKTYAVFCTLLIDSQNPTGFVGRFHTQPVRADLIEIGSDAQSATDLKDFADAGYDPGTNKVQGVVLTDTCTTLTGHTAQTGDNYVRLGAPAGASVSADIAAAKVDTAAILADTGTDGVVVASLAANSVTASSLATDAVNEIADGVWDEAIAGHVAAGSFGLQCGTDIDAILVDTNSLNDTKVPDTISLAAINAECDTAISDAALATAATVGTPLLASLAADVSSGKYALGAVWIDTVNGTAGTTDWVNGTDSNPVSTLADAVTIAASVGLTAYVLAPGSSITLTSTHANWRFIARNATVALGGQSVSGSVFEGATITGTGTGASAPAFHECDFGVSTLPSCTARRCRLTGNITLVASGDYHFLDCASGYVAPAEASITCTEPNTVHLRGFSGGVEFKSMDILSKVEIEGNGSVTLNASCIGGSIRITGNWSKTDNSGGAVDVTEIARIATDAINAECDTAISDAALATAATVGTPAGASVSADIAAVKTDTAAILADTGTDGVVVASLTSGAITDVWSTDTLPEAYNADGSAGTPAQLLYTLLQSMTEFAISGTTITVKKLDGSTTAATYTLDDGTNPTSRTRAS